MRNPVQNVIDALKEERKDSRNYIFEVSSRLKDGVFNLSGKVLDQDDLKVLKAALKKQAGEHPVGLMGIEVLSSSKNERLFQRANLCGMYKGPSFLEEQLQVTLFGWYVEVLLKEEDCALVRAEDGYLGWVPLKFYGAEAPAKATHVVCATSTLIRAKAAANGEILDRVYAGTFLRVDAVKGSWAKVEATVEGWVPLADLRDLQTGIPSSEEEKRKQIVADAKKFIGVPYEWGGGSVNGIDCSGFAQTIMRMNGIPLRRDADMQYEDGVKVEQPNLKPGDLVYFGELGERRKVTHTGISLGGWDIIHASRRPYGVHVENMQDVPSLMEIFLGGATYL